MLPCIHSFRFSLKLHKKSSRQKHSTKNYNSPQKKPATRLKSISTRPTTRNYNTTVPCENKRRAGCYTTTLLTYPGNFLSPVLWDWLASNPKPRLNRDMWDVLTRMLLDALHSGIGWECRKFGLGVTGFF